MSGPATHPIARADRQGRSGPLMPTGHATEKQAACVDRSEYSNSPDVLPVEADSAGEAPSSSRASPATNPDDIDLTIPDFLRRGTEPVLESVDAV